MEYSSNTHLKENTALKHPAGVQMGRWVKGKVYRNPPSFGNDERGDANAQMAPAARNKLSMCVLK